MQDGRLSIERAQMEGKNKTYSLVTGNITWGMLWFAVPMILGNLLQQFYNIADTLIVGRFLGAEGVMKAYSSCCGFGLYVDDFSDFGPSGFMHGKRGCFFASVRSEGS